MTPAISSTTLSIANFRAAPDDMVPVFNAGDRSRPLIVRRMAQARRMRLSVDPRGGTVQLILPRRTAMRAALAWVEERRGWIEEQLAILPPSTPITPDALIMIEGVPLRIDWQPGASRTIHRMPDRLTVGGPLESLSSRILRWLKREAQAVLEQETREIGRQAGVTIGRVGVGDPRSRWGSCSSAGDVRYSWRLILAPPDVRRATVAHEVAHRLHMDHSAAFHEAAARLFGRDPAPERRWLRQHGPSLHWLGRDG